MKKSMIFIVLMAALMGCIRYQHRSPIPESQKICNRMVVKLAKEAYLEDGLRCTGRSGGAIGGVNCLGISFDSFDHTTMTIDEARVLIVKWTERYGLNINQHIKLRPFLKYFPFTAEHIEISIGFCDRSGNRLTKESIAYVATNWKGIRYCVEGEEDGPFKYVHLETYEEARRIVGEKHPELLLEFQDPSVIPTSTEPEPL